MLIRLFKTSQPLSLFILPVLSLILGGAFFLKDNFLIIEKGMPLYLLFIRFLTVNKSLVFITVVSLITLQAFHFNRILQKHEIMYKNSFLPLLFYVLTCSLVPQFWSFHPLLFVNSILLLVLDKTFSLYKSEGPISKSFDICFLIAIASMFYLQAVILILFYVAALLLLRPFSWKEWAAGCMGFVVPFFLIIVFYFINDHLSELKNLMQIDLDEIRIDYKNINFYGLRVTVFFTLILFFFSALKLRANFFKNVIRTRRFQQTIFLFLFFSIIIVLTSMEVSIFRFFIFCIPVSFFFSYYFLAIRKNWFSEVLFWLFIVVVMNNFIH